MFDIGFFELAVVMVVALLVIGPERLPGLARTAGLWIGKGQAMVRSIKADIDRELTTDELKQGLVGRDGNEELTDLFAEAKELAEDVRCNFHLDASGRVDTGTTQESSPAQDSSQTG